MGDVSAATRRVVYLLAGPNQSDIWTAPLDAPERAEAYLANGFQLGHPSMSPEGRWMAYDSDESGRLEVYVQSFPDPTKGRFQVSSVRWH